MFFCCYIHFKFKSQVQKYWKSVMDNKVQDFTRFYNNDSANQKSDFHEHVLWVMSGKSPQSTRNWSSTGETYSSFWSERLESIWRVNASFLKTSHEGKGDFNIVKYLTLSGWSVGHTGQLTCGTLQQIFPISNGLRYILILGNCVKKFSTFVGYNSLYSGFVF